MIYKVAEFGINRGTYVQRAEILLPICDRQNMIGNTPDCIIVEENSKQKIKKKSKSHQEKFEKCGGGLRSIHRQNLCAINGRNEYF